MCGCPCFAYGPLNALESERGRGYRYGPPPWARYSPPWARHWWAGPGPTKTEHKESLEALKKHLEEELAEVTKELERL